jgi:hypothetical protein
MEKKSTQMLMGNSTPVEFSATGTDQIKKLRLWQNEN